MVTVGGSEISLEHVAQPGQITHDDGLIQPHTDKGDLIFFLRDVGAELRVDGITGHQRNQKEGKQRNDQQQGNRLHDTVQKVFRHFGCCLL